MGVINMTPDSFHQASRAADGSLALALADRLSGEGASLLDVGAESTRPGAARIDARTQIDRLDHLLDATRGRITIPWSVDTTLAPVAAHATARGASAINDVSAGLEDPAILGIAAERGCGLILMHRALPPDRDSYSDRYAPGTAAPPMSGDVVAQVGSFLLERAGAAIDAGVDRERIALDPGFGFGKTVEQNIQLARRIGEIVDLGFPVVAGVSRKSFVGRISEPDRDTTPDERLPGTLAMGLALAERGVRVLRVHDVAAHARAIRAWRAVGAT